MAHVPLFIVLYIGIILIVWAFFYGSADEHQYASEDEDEHPLLSPRYRGRP